MWCANLRLIQYVTSQIRNHFKIDSWLTNMCQHEHQYNTNCDQDENALQDKLESPLVLNRVELNRLKGKRVTERSIEEDTAHLEDQVHPGDAEAD